MIKLYIPVTASVMQADGGGNQTFLKDSLACEQSRNFPMEPKNDDQYHLNFSQTNALPVITSYCGVSWHSG